MTSSARNVHASINGPRPCDFMGEILHNGEGFVLAGSCYVSCNDVSSVKEETKRQLHRDGIGTCHCLCTLGGLSGEHWPPCFCFCFCFCPESYSPLYLNCDHPLPDLFQPHGPIAASHLQATRLLFPVSTTPLGWFTWPTSALVSKLRRDTITSEKLVTSPSTLPPL